MASSFRHVSYEERCKIDALKEEGLSLSEIARRLGRSQVHHQSRGGAQ